MLCWLRVGCHALSSATRHHAQAGLREVGQRATADIVRQLQEGEGAKLQLVGQEAQLPGTSVHHNLTFTHVCGATGRAFAHQAAAAASPPVKSGCVSWGCIRTAQ